MSQISVETKFIPGKTFTLTPITSFYEPFVDNKLYSYISCWVDADGNIYANKQEVTFSGEKVDLSAKWVPIDRDFQVTLVNCSAVLSCVPNKFPSMSSTIDLTASGLSALIYQDSKLVLSVIPTENCTFTSAALYGPNSDYYMHKQTLVFDKIADADNECSVMLSSYILSEYLKNYLPSNIYYHTDSYKLQLSVVCTPNGRLTYWSGVQGEEVA